MSRCSNGNLVYINVVALLSSLAHSEILTTHVEIEQQFLNNIFPMESFLAAIIISFNETTIKEQKLLGTQNHQDIQHTNFATS